MAEAGCARPTGASVGGSENGSTEEVEATQSEEKSSMQKAMVGKPAPDFEAPAYYQGKFTRVKLSEYLGNWTLLCFYPGDFTFV